MLGLKFVLMNFCLTNRLTSCEVSSDFGMTFPKSFQSTLSSSFPSTFVFWQLGKEEEKGTCDFMYFTKRHDCLLCDKIAKLFSNVLQEK